VERMCRHKNATAGWIGIHPAARLPRMPLGNYLCIQRLLANPIATNPEPSSRIELGSGVVVVPPQFEPSPYEEVVAEPLPSGLVPNQPEHVTGPPNLICAVKAVGLTLPSMVNVTLSWVPPEFLEVMVKNPKSFSFPLPVSLHPAEGGAANVGDTPVGKSIPTSSIPNAVSVLVPWTHVNVTVVLPPLLPTVAVILPVPIWELEAFEVCTMFRSVAFAGDAWTTRTSTSAATPVKIPFIRRALILSPLPFLWFSQE
jgi:hypothetical protein